MLFNMLIFALMVLIFCFFTMIFVIKTMISVLNAVKPEEMDEIKPIQIIKKPEKKRVKDEYELYLEEQERKKREQYNIIMDNLDVYDGTEKGQKEVI